MRNQLTLLLAAILPICCGETSNVPIDVELCVIAANPAPFNGQLVQVRASVLADGHHGAVLFDARCPERGLGLDYAGARGTASVQRLDDAIFRTGRPGSADKDITALFVGTVRWDRPRWWQRARGPRASRRVLEIRDIADFHIAPKPLFWQLKELKSPFTPRVKSSVGGSPSLDADVASLTIDDIRWDLTPFGLWPGTRSERANRVQIAGKTAVPLLRDALQDPWRFAAAHVFLTWASDARFELSYSEYNGMLIELQPDGRVRIPDQRVKLQEYWSDPLPGGP
jgi:hypothetical protein